MLKKRDRMMITNRLYRHKIEVFKLCGEETNEIGEVIQTQTKVYDLWAEVMPIRGKEYVSVETLVPEMQYKIVTRYRPDIDQSMIVRWQGKDLNIKAIIDISGREEHMELMCEERVDINGEL